VTFPTLIEDLFVTVRPLADEHGCTLNLKSEGDTKVTTDPRRVRQILLNLLSNAIKFGSHKPIEVVTCSDGKGGVVIEVTDHGEGIPPQDQERIFHEFVQLGKTQLQDGTGLGLPISRRLAELLQGTLSVKSKIGEGSTFRLTLPEEAEARPVAVEHDVTAEPVVDAIEREEAEPEIERPLVTAKSLEHPPKERKVERQGLRH
jgi:signal transduction histidine kinase